MNDPRERLLAETIKNKMIGILKSEEIYPGVATLRDNILNMNDGEMEKASKKVASKVHTWITRETKNSGKKPTGIMINRRVKMELESL